MRRTMSRDSSSSKFNGLLRMTLNTLRRLYVDSHGEAGKVIGEKTEIVVEVSYCD